MGPASIKRHDDIIIFSMDGPHVTPRTAAANAHSSGQMNVEKLVRMVSECEPAPVKYPPNRAQRRAMMKGKRA